MFEHFLAGSGLRFVEVVVYSSLWIVIGCFIAAIFRRMLGEEKVRQLLPMGLVGDW